VCSNFVGISINIIPITTIIKIIINKTTKLFFIKNHKIYNKINSNKYTNNIYYYIFKNRLLNFLKNVVIFPYFKYFF